MNDANFIGSNNDHYNQSFSFYERFRLKTIEFNNLTKNFTRIDLSNLYSYLVYILEENLYENNYFQLKPYYITFWRNSVNSHIFDKYRKTRNINSNGLSINNIFLNYIFPLNSNHIIKSDIIMKSFQDFSKGENYIGIANINFNKLTEFENIYLKN